MTHCHPVYEGGDVDGGVPCVCYGCKIVKVGSTTVPVHHQDVHVSLRGQQTCDVVDPDGGRAGGPVAVDDEGGGSHHVKQRLVGEVVVRKLVATVQVGARVQEQTHIQIGSNERLVEVQVRKVITHFVCTCLDYRHQSLLSGT